MNKRKVKQLTLITAALSLAISNTGCMLLPEEQEVKKVTVVREFEDVKYDMVTVKQEDVTEFKTISCTYTQLEDEELAFAMGGKEVHKVYYSLGDSVKKGDLIAELNVEELDKQIEEMLYTIEKAEKEIHFFEKQKSIEIKKVKKMHELGSITKESREERISLINDSYKTKKSRANDVLYINKMKYEELLKEKEKSRIFAEMDGTIAFLQPGLSGSIVEADKVVVKIIDSSECAFKSTAVEFMDYFKNQEVIEVQGQNGTIYPTRLMPRDQEEDSVYFQLVVPDFELAVGSGGTIKLVVNESKNTLSLPIASVHKGDGFYYVYYLDENGSRGMKEITIGIVGNSSIEILDGLELGDIVING